MNKVSFVIPSYNSVAWLSHAVKSCQEQTVKDIEIVIVDDCSTDTTGVYLDWLTQKDTRVKAIRLPKNVGRSEARNIGNKAASGDIICVLDADDLAINTRAHTTLKMMKKGYQMIYGSAVVMDALGNGLNEIPALPIDKEKILKTKTNGIVHSSVAYTKEIAEKYPYKSGKISDLGIDDWEQQVRIILGGEKVGFTPETLTAYRLLETAITQNRDEEEVAKTKAEILEGLK